MKRLFGVLLVCTLLWSPFAAGCSRPTPQQSGLKVLAVETFLADIAQNVAGERLQVAALMPIGVDPHAFQPTPADVARVAQADVLIVNGAGLESFLGDLLQQSGRKGPVIEASAGLAMRAPREGEDVHEHEEEHEQGEPAHHHHEGDPHFWLAPHLVIRYVENIRDGLTQADPAGRDVYAGNASAYIAQLQELDAWVAAEIAKIPPAQRLLVTNHESLGYYADRYGLRVVGTIVPSTSTGASPSAQELARLQDRIRATGVKAIFLETGTNPQLAQQIARDTGVKVITEMYTHSITPPDGSAPTYIAMIRHNTQMIVNALK
ncbi:MAG: metal ABC transporter substrate-binding protein [Anaerolineae bacterium]